MGAGVKGVNLICGSADGAAAELNDGQPPLLLLVGLEAVEAEAGAGTEEVKVEVGVLGISGLASVDVVTLDFCSCSPTVAVLSALTVALAVVGVVVVG